MKADGIEANYLYTDRNNEIINEIEEWNEFAKENNLFVTMGSDFHVQDGKHIELGFTNTNLILEDKEICEILDRISNKV